MHWPRADKEKLPCNYVVYPQTSNICIRYVEIQYKDLFGISPFVWIHIINVFDVL